MRFVKLLHNKSSIPCIVCSTATTVCNIAPACFKLHGLPLPVQKPTQNDAHDDNSNDDFNPYDKVYESNSDFNPYDKVHDMEPVAYSVPRSVVRLYTIL